MKLIRIYLFIITLTFNLNLFSQDSIPFEIKSIKLNQDLLKYQTTPQYNFKNLKADLPYKHDNSIHPFFPPLRGQMAYWY
ncbi:MAG: hypothetical protein JXR58_13410 [Bacteroidales bacterium]|nr:hypothetical protein [Bacteroidales bacterium]